jgi:hypothetical protein
MAVTERTCERCLSSFYGDSRFCEECVERMEYLDRIERSRRFRSRTLTATLILTFLAIFYIMWLDDPKGFVMGWVVTFSILAVFQIIGLVVLLMSSKDDGTV